MNGSHEFEVRESSGGEPQLVHDPCGALLGSVEHGDTLEVLMSLASGHLEKCAVRS